VKNEAASSILHAPNLSDQEFRQFQGFIYKAAGISLPPAKKSLVANRLAKRLGPCGVRDFSDYFRLLSRGDRPDEVQTAIDLLTTNETYFFREQKHFDLLREFAGGARSRSQPVRIWSAASSSGEEGYSIAMVLEDVLPGRGWEVVGTDISTRVVERARTGHYVMERARNVPRDYLRRFCRKGFGAQDGTMLVNADLRRKVSFLHGNLVGEMPSIGEFDIVFLRNVMIYFDLETRREVVRRVLQRLRAGGYLLIGHSETLMDVTSEVQTVSPSIYRKPTRQ